jgi:hypothetical protein
MEFEMQPGPLGDYAKELKEEVHENASILVGASEPERNTMAQSTPTVFEDEIVQQTLLLKGFHHKAHHQVFYNCKKQVFLLCLLLWNWLWAIGCLGFYAIVNDTLRQTMYNYKLKSEFLLWKSVNDQLDKVLAQTIRWVKESEIVARGYRLSTNLNPIEHLKQELRYQTSMELRRMVYYVLKELIIDYRQIDFRNEDYLNGLKERLAEPLMDFEDPLSLKHLKEVKHRTIDIRLCLLYYWNMNFKLNNLQKKLGCIYHIQMLQKKTSCLLRALQAVVHTEQSNIC